MLYYTKNPHGGDIYQGDIHLDFSANTNPFGTPPAVLQAISAALPQLHCYPDPYCRQLITAIETFEAVPREWILCGNGAAELIYAYCRALQPRRAMELAPTFSEYSLALEQVGCQVQRYQLKQCRQFALDEDFLAVLEQSCPDVLFLCNPNNPTGQLLPPSLLQKILAVCQRKNIHLFVDECFLDLADKSDSLKKHLEQYPQLLLLKAFTKSYGMAGVRLGYCLCAQAQLLQKMAQMVQPWNVSLLAQAAGVAALQQESFLQNTRSLIAVERPWLQKQLENLGFWVCPSQVNYLLFQGPENLHQRLKAYGIAIRSCANYHGLGQGWYRIAVRQHSENERLIHAIGLVLKKEQPWQKTL